VLITDVSAPRRRLRPALAGLFVALVLCTPALAGAQRLFGAGEDAQVLKRGELRWSLGGRWNAFDEQLDAGGQRVPINGKWTSADAGTEFFGGLIPTQGGLRAALGDSSARVSLGTTRLRSEYHHEVVPFNFELGLSKRLTIAVSIPLVLSYVSAAFDINRVDPTPANIGLNPGFGAGNANGAVALTVQTQANAAVTALQAAFPSCFTGAPGAGCASTIALARNTTALGNGVAGVYGTAGRFAPVLGSNLDNALNARFIAINSALRTALGIPVGGTDPITARPTAAAVRMAVGDFNKLLLDRTYGVQSDTLTVLERTALGDAEVSARYQWLNTFDGAARDSGRVNPSGLRLRSTAGLTVRLGTAARPYIGKPLDLGAGDGATGIEVRSTTDLIAGDHFWASVTGRYTKMLGDQVDRRIPLSSAEAIVPISRKATIQRQLGDYAELEVTPRWMFNDYFAVSADYYLYLRKGTTFSGGAITITDPFSGGPLTLDPSVLNTSRQVAQRLGFGLAYSTVAAAARGKTRIPLDVRWQRIMTVGGENTPFSFQDRLELRVITSLFGRK
jgi:hypothetical protein